MRSNLKAAAALGIHTIRVEPASSVPALRALEKYVDMPLLDDNDSGRARAQAKL